MAIAIARAEQDLADAHKEISDLEARLVALKERAVKLAHFLELAKIYEANSETANSSGYREAAQPSPQANGAASTTRSAPKGGVSGAAVRETLIILRERGQPTPTRELLSILASRGINIGGKNPVISLSGYLCKTHEVVSDRARGWSLREWTQSSGVH
jgi:hypothetical protein